jgi:hypothetical protein
MIVCLLVIIAVPVLASDGSVTTVNSQFNIGDGTHGKNIPIGSTVTEYSNGTTEVVGPNNSVVLKANDSDSPIISTPDGPAQADRIFEVPNGTHFITNGNVVTAYQNNVAILTVVNLHYTSSTNNLPDSTNNPPQLGRTGSWIEDAYDTGIKADYNSAYWVVPHMPVGHDANAYDYVFNGETDWTESNIIQPVLQYNYGSDHCWTAADWYGMWGTYWKTPDMVVNEGDLIQGTMTFEGNDVWNIQITDINTSISMLYYMQQLNFGPNNLFGQMVCWTLEGYQIQNNNDVPDSILFSNITLTRNGNPVSLNLKTCVGSNFSQLTNLSVGTSPTSVALYTANWY